MKVVSSIELVVDEVIQVISGGGQDRQNSPQVLCRRHGLAFIHQRCSNFDTVFGGVVSDTPRGLHLGGHQALCVLEYVF
ncbi:hypothetical protein [Kordiimonas aestuarii]|uniref:hypothetical protein n=1 Tax=Kordiimonas aestuarii TaxID=1005925 RepID=UPI0021CEF284|nr:hypothetical protein [Kordiimonas aestuarii]